MPQILEPVLCLPAHRDRSPMYIELVAGLVSEFGGTSISLSPVVCPGGRCVPAVGGVVVRPDGLHFSGTFAVRLVEPRTTYCTESRNGPLATEADPNARA
jgi:hypothetical protein